MTSPGRRFWEDVRFGLYGSIATSVLTLFTGSGSTYALSHFWQSLLWLVPASFVGTELARGLHALIVRRRQHSLLTKPTKLSGL